MHGFHSAMFTALRPTSRSGVTSAFRKCGPVSWLLLYSTVMTLWVLLRVPVVMMEQHARQGEERTIFLFCAPPALFVVLGRRV